VSALVQFMGSTAFPPPGLRWRHTNFKALTIMTTAALELNKISYCYILTIPVVFTKSRKSCPKLSHA
jgi:hypothetical protein